MKRLILLCAVLAVTVGAFQSAAQTPARYRSEATLWLIPSQIPDAPPSPMPLDLRVEGIKQSVLSRTGLERIVARVNLYASERASMPMTDVVDLMRKDIDIHHVGTHVVVVGFTGVDPVSVQAATTELMGRVSSQWALNQARWVEDARAILEAQIQELAALIEKRAAPTSRLATLDAEAQDAAYRDLVTKRIASERHISMERRQLGEQLVIMTPASAPTRVDAGK